MKKMTPSISRLAAAALLASLAAFAGCHTDDSAKAPDTSYDPPSGTIIMDTPYGNYPKADRTDSATSQILNGQSSGGSMFDGSSQ